MIVAYKVSDSLIIDYSTKSFTRETIEILSNLKIKKVKAEVFHDESSKIRLANIFSLLKNYIEPLNVEFFEADYEPGRIKKHNITKIPSTVLTLDGKKIILEDHSELSIVNSFLAAKKNKMKRIIFLKGQGQRSLDDNSSVGIGHLIERIDKDIFNVLSLDLLQIEKIDSNDLLISIGQKRDFSDKELDKILAARESGADFMFFIDPYFKEASLKKLNSFLGGYNLKLRPGYLKIRDGFVDGSNGLAPLFNDKVFHGKKLDRVFFPFSTAIFSSEKLDHENDFFIPEGNAAFLTDINIANNLNFEEFAIKKFKISNLSRKYFNGNESNLFILGNSTFLQNKFKNLFDTRGLFLKMVDICAKDNAVKSLNIPLRKEKEFVLEKKLEYSKFFLYSSVFFFLLISLLLNFFKPKRKYLL